MGGGRRRPPRQPRPRPCQSCAISAGRQRLSVAHHELAGLPDGAGLVPMDPAEVSDQSEPRRRAARDHQPAFQRGRARCVEKADTLRCIRNFVVLVSTAAADRARVTPCPSRISCPEAWRHPGDRPQVAVRGAAHRRFRAPGPERAPAALSRRATAADSICSVALAGAELHRVELFGGSTAGRRAHPRLLRASHTVLSSRATAQVGARPPPSQSRSQRCVARSLSPRGRWERPIWPRAAIRQACGIPIPHLPSTPPLPLPANTQMACESRARSPHPSPAGQARPDEIPSRRSAGSHREPPGSSSYWRSKGRAPARRLPPLS